MSSFEMRATGTIKKNFVPKQCKYKTEKELEKLGRGTSDCLVRDDRLLAGTVWYDNKPIYMVSNEYGVALNVGDGVRKQKAM